MGIFNFFTKRNKKQKRRTGRRGYQSAAISRITNDWPSDISSVATLLQSSLRTLRGRSRYLARNSDYGKKFLNLCKANIVGHQGIGLQVQSKEANGELDKGANALLEREFKEWGKVGSCTVDGKLSWIDCQKLFIETVASDGEIIIRMIRGWKYNKYRFALQFIEADHLDEYFNVPMRNGYEIRMGVKFDSWGRPVAYPLLKNHPGDTMHVAITAGNKYNWVQAEDIIHKFLIERTKQPRGVPWMVTPMLRMKILDGYENAELIAARTAASKMGFFTSPDGQGYTGDEEEESTKDIITEAEPGIFEQLPDGVDFKSWTPDHPTTAFEAFTKSILRGIASGLNVSYVSLSNDLTGVNYSSIRQGSLDERDAWRMLQTWEIEHFCQRVWENWLLMALTTGAVKLPIGKFEKFNNVAWRPRGWQWVDPLREGKANENAVKAGIKSLQDIASEQGRDISDVLNQIANEKKMAEDLGLDLSVFQIKKPMINATGE